MNKFAKTLFSAAIGVCAACTGVASAQQAPASQAASKASIPGLQEGVVYPGQSSASAQSQASQQSAAQPTARTKAATQNPGGLPSLPALPGDTSAISPTRQAVNDLVPEDVASELTELKKRVDDVLRAAGTPVDSSAKPQANHVKLTQKPDEDPPVVRVASGLPTSLIFTDVTGAPWPIEYAVPGSAGQFDIMLPSAGTPTLQLRPRTPHAYGGINVKLVDNPIPVSVIVAAAQKTVDVRLDVVILKRGPNAIAPMIQGGGSSDTQADSILTSFLYGIPPSGAKALTSTSKRVDAWYYNNLMYVRSSIPLVSPNPIKSSRSVDGTYAYMFTQVPIVNVTEDGVISSVSFVE